jgi:hypothetical protein
VKTAEGYAVSEPGSLLKEWVSIYGKKEIFSYSCYSLDSPSVFEGKLRILKLIIANLSGQPTVEGAREEMAEAVLKRKIIQ